MRKDLVSFLPSDVVGFVAECRAKTYKIGAEPNFGTGNTYQYGFQYALGEMVYTDVSTEQNGRFAGYEQVSIHSGNPKLNGQKFYVIHYAGADTPVADFVGSDYVMQAQHGLVIDNPTIVRFGSTSVNITTEVQGRKFFYIEKSTGREWGRTNSENLSVRLRDGALQAVYTGASQFILFQIK